MDEIRLPALPISASLEDALSEMRQHDVGAIVRLGPSAEVVEANGVVQAYRESGNLALGAAGSGAPANFAPGFTLATHFADLQRLFSQSGHEFILLGAAGPTMSVVTVSEQIAARLQGAPTICRCRTSPRHIWRPRELLNPGRCNIDNDPVDCS